MGSSESWSSEWLDVAKDDLRVAEYLLSLHPVPLEIVCFHCQQATEKALKAVLTSFDIVPPKTHDLPTLCSLCAEKDSRYQRFEDPCVMLTAYGVQTRYPPSMELAQEDVDQALGASRQIVKYVEETLSPTN
jgi:HEPN domain-containing protein